MRVVSGSLSPCPGESVVLECQVEGGLATVWKMSNCHDKIQFRHSEYTSDEQDENKIEKCNSQGRSVQKADNLFISQLNVTVTQNDVEVTIGCFRFTSSKTETVIGMIQIAGMYSREI